MPSEAIATIAHDVVAINRSTARKAIETQCKGVMRLIDAPVSVIGKTKEKFNVGTKFSGKLGEVGTQARHKTETLLENYGRVAAEVIDWVSDRTDSGIAKVDETLLSRGGPVLDRVLLPGAEFLRRFAQQTASMTERVADFVVTAGPVVTETAAKPKPGVRKTKAAAHRTHA